MFGSPCIGNKDRHLSAKWLKKTSLCLAKGRFVYASPNSGEEIRTYSAEVSAGSTAGCSAGSSACGIAGTASVLSICS